MLQEVLGKEKKETQLAQKKKKKICLERYITFLSEFCVAGNELGKKKVKFRNRNRLWFLWQGTFEGLCVQKSLTN